MTIITNEKHLVVSVSLMMLAITIPESWHCYSHKQLEKGIPIVGDFYFEDDEKRTSVRDQSAREYSSLETKHHHHWMEGWIAGYRYMLKLK